MSFSGVVEQAYNLRTERLFEENPKFKFRSDNMVRPYFKTLNI